MVAEQAQLVSCVCVERLGRKQGLYLSVKPSHFAAALSGLAAPRLFYLHPLGVLQLQGLKLLDHVRTATDQREQAE